MKARFFAIAAMVLSLASCQRDQAGLDSVVAGEQDVNITVALPEVTRATNSEVGALGNIDLTQYDLRYILEVYEGEDLAKERFVNYEDNATSTNFSMRLIPGRDYRFVVWADFVLQGTQADLHYNTSDLKSVEAINLAAIDESRDAYTAICNVEDFTSAKGIPAIELKRPFGKLRVQTTDVNQMTTLRPVGVTVTYFDTKFAHKFNAFTSEAIADYVEVDPVTVDLTADACKYTNEDPEANGLQTLYADYFFATESGDVKFEFDVELNDGTVVPTLSFNTYIPVMRNVLTTVRGNVLTDGASIDVFINDTFEGDGILKDFVFVCNAAELQAAVNNYAAGQTIIFENDIKGNVTVPEYADTVLTIDGNGYKYDGCFRIIGKSEYANATTLFKSINFETADASGFVDSAFIYCREQTGNTNTRYPDNVTIQDCTFTATGAAVEAAVGAKFWSLNGNVIVENSSANGMHSLLQLSSCGEANVTVNGVEIANCKNGLSLQHSNNVIKNTNIATREYGVRVDGAVAATSFENTEITATLPVVVRKMKADSKIALDFVATTLNAPGYQVVLTTGNDDGVFVAPADGTYTLTGADSYLVFPGDYTFVYNAAQLQSVLDNVAGDTTIQFAANIEGNVMAHEIDGCTVTIEGHDHSYNGYIQINGKTKYADATTVFSNINFVTNGASALLGDAFIYCGEGKGTSYRYPDNVTIKGCTFTASDAAVEKSVGAKFWAINGNLVVENCSADKLHSMIQLTSCSKANVTIDGAVIANGKNGISLGDAGEVLIKNANIAAREYGVRADGAVATTSFENTEITANLPVVVRKMKANSNYILNFDATTLNAPRYQVVLTTGNDDATFVAPADGTYTLTGADSYNVFPLDADKVAYTADDFKSLLAAGKTEIILMPGEYTMPATGGNDITIIGGEDTVINLGATNTGSSDVTLYGVTIKAGQYKGFQHSGVVTYNNVTIEGELFCYGEKDIFNNCTFELNNGYVWTYGSKEVVFEGCTFNTNGKAILVYNEGAGATKVAVNNCTFNATAKAYAGAIKNQNCAAIEIDNFQNSLVGVAHNITTSNNTVGENFSGEWRIKNYVAGDAITVNGVNYEQIAIDGKLMTIDASKNVTVL